MGKQKNSNTKGFFLSGWKNYKEKFYTTIEKQIVEIKEKPFKVALGCALGIGINFIPTFGVGFVLAYFLAIIFRANQACAAATSLLTGILIPIMYALNFVTGGLILVPVMEKENILEFIKNQYFLILRTGPLKDKILSAAELFGVTFLLGAVVNAFVFSLGFYFFVNYILKRYKS